ncbi:MULTISPECIES: DUF6339 family protein [unclassified Kribbella]|uniref:DUF6339 family protein n=1 Tax=unclassified Kribbella TaxID=2644121 RepID=UPI00301A1FA7
MSTLGLDAPPTLGLLSDSAVAQWLSQGVRSGQEDPPQVAIRKASTLLQETDARWRSTPVVELLDEAMQRFDGARAKADAWLAPRLHATLRMTRGEAADNRLWNFMAMALAPEYVVWRHRGSESAPASRFCGPHYTQAFARLWWAAELFRNGDDYRPVETACKVQDVLNTTMRLDVIDHRPTALTIIRLVSRLIEAEVPRVGDHVNALSSAVNAAGSTLVYDVLTSENVVNYAALQEWIGDAEGMAPVPWDRLPEGPDDGQVEPEAIDALMPLFETLLAEAPIRRRPRHSASEEEPLN